MAKPSIFNVSFIMPTSSSIEKFVQSRRELRANLPVQTECPLLQRLGPIVRTTGSDIRADRSRQVSESRRSITDPEVAVTA